MSTLPTAAEMIRMPLLFPITGRSTVRNDVVYRSDGETKLPADIYRPALRKGERRPVVVFVHGGPLPATAAPKDWRVFRDYGRMLAGRGFIAVTFNHRYSKMNEFATSAADVAALLDYVRAHAEEIGADPDRTVVWVFSGGGPLIATLAGRPGTRAIVSFYALLDGPQGFSPCERVAADGFRLPILIARAGHDMADLNESVGRFFAECLAHGVPVELINHPDGVHAFDILTDDLRTREVIRRAVEFVRDQTR